MPERKTKVPMPGPSGAVTMTDAVEVDVSESTERWTEIHLEDGSVLKLKPVIMGAARLEGLFDADGNPVYFLKTNQVMAVVSAPEHLRKGGSVPKGVH